LDQAREIKLSLTEGGKRALELGSKIIEAFKSIPEGKLNPAAQGSINYAIRMLEAGPTGIQKFNRFNNENGPRKIIKLSTTYWIR
jgi:hypothetical protein